MTVKSARASSRRRRRRPPVKPELPASEAATEVRPAVQETPFDEPATPKPEPNVPVERPQPVAREEDGDPCGLSDETVPRASDLH